MSRLLLRVGRPDQDALDRVLEAASAAEPTYRFVGATIDDGAASPHPVRRHHHDLGRGDDVFAKAVEGLRSWVQHRGVLARIHPADAPLRAGTTVVVVLPAGPVTILAPCRIVRVVETDRRVGFAYGSLPGHPADGEEAFVLDHLADGTVRFTIGVAARSSTAALRAVEPVVVGCQRVAISRYLGAMQAHVSGASRHR